MPNTFLTNDVLADAADDAAILLSNNLVAAQLTNRDVEEDIVDRDTGGKVRVEIRPELAANLDERDAGNITLTKTDNNQSAVEIDATNYVYQRQSMPTVDSTWGVDDFTREVTEPAVLAIREQVDTFFVRRIAGGYSENVISDDSSIGTHPADVADVLNAMQTLNEQKAPQAGRVGLISATTHANLLGLDQFTSADFGDDAPAGLREGALARRYGFGYFMDQNVGTHPFGDTGGAVTNGSLSGGETEIDVDGLNTADGQINEGARFDLGGSTVYTVADRVQYSGNSATIPVTPAIDGSVADGTALNFQTAHTQDVFYNPDFALGAIVAPEPVQGAMSEVGTFGNVAVRISVVPSMEGSDGLSEDILYDVYIGSKVTKPETGVVLQA